MNEQAKPAAPAKSAEPVVADKLSLTIRFAQRDSTNPKAPIAEADIMLPGLLSGLLLQASVWARRDARGQVTDYDVSFPTAGRGRTVVDVAPIYVKSADGAMVPVHKSQDAHGAKAALMFPVEASRAYREFLKTGNPEQVISW